MLKIGFSEIKSSLITAMGVIELFYICVYKKNKPGTGLFYTLFDVFFKKSIFYFFKMLKNHFIRFIFLDITFTLPFDLTVML